MSVDQRILHPDTNVLCAYFNQDEATSVTVQETSDLRSSQTAAARTFDPIPATNPAPRNISSLVNGTTHEQLRTPGSSQTGTARLAAQAQAGLPVSRDTSSLANGATSESSTVASGIRQHIPEYR